MEIHPICFQMHYCEPFIRIFIPRVNVQSKWHNWTFRWTRQTSPNHLVCSNLPLQASLLYLPPPLRCNAPISKSNQQPKLEQPCWKNAGGSALNGSILFPTVTYIWVKQKNIVWDLILSIWNGLDHCHLLIAVILCEWQIERGGIIVPHTSSEKRCHRGRW